MPLARIARTPDINPRIEQSKRSSFTLYDAINEFYSDLLGILTPGILFALASAALFYQTAKCFIRTFGTLGEIREFYETTHLFLGERAQLSISLSIFLIVFLGFVVGGVFFRLDPKLPDRRSIEKILRRTKWADLERCEVQIERASCARFWNSLVPHRLPTRTYILGLIDQVYRLLDWMMKRENDDFVGWVSAKAIAEGEGAQFPYSHLRAYLNERGLVELAGRIPWSPEEGLNQRTKMFINMLKIRLQLLADWKCATIVRNEAHIRMMSSVWFASRTLFSVCGLTAFPIAAAALHVYLGNGHNLKQALLANGIPEYAAVASFIIMVSSWLKSHLEKCFHYQRVREIFYVLETAESIERYWPIQIFDPNPPPRGSGRLDV